MVWNWKSYTAAVGLVGIGVAQYVTVFGLTGAKGVKPTWVNDPAIKQRRWRDNTSVYDFYVTDIDGNEVSFEKYRGHPMIIVNVASKCTLMKRNYAGLNELYKKYEGQGLRIAAFPCNQFNNQEPGTNAQIKRFATEHGVEFDLYAKVDVNGDSAAPIYKWLRARQTGYFGWWLNYDQIKWNFTKFVIDKEGHPVERYAPTTSPESFEDVIKSLL